MKRTGTAALSLLSVLLLASCATQMKAVIGTDNKQESGKVLFYTATHGFWDTDTIGLDITLEREGFAPKTIKNHDWWSTKQELLVTLPQGQWKATVRHRYSWSTELDLDVRAGTILFASIRRQDIKWESFDVGLSSGSVTTYILSASDATDRLPIAARVEDYANKLSSLDWGIRHYSLKQLKKQKAPLSAPLLESILNLATEDPVSYVREAAEKLLGKDMLTRREDVLFLEGFEENKRGLWPLVNRPDADVATWIGTDGYFMQNKSDFDRFTNPLHSWLRDNNTRALIHLDCFHLDGLDNRLFGLALGENDDSMLFCGITAYGEASIWVKKGTDWTQLLPWTEAARESIRTNSGGRISVQLQEGSLSMSVNGIEVGSIEHNLLLLRAGFVVSGQQTVLFHRLQARL